MLTLEEMKSIVARENQKKSWAKRTKGKTKKEISDMMAKIAKHKRKKLSTD